MSFGRYGRPSAGDPWSTINNKESTLYTHLELTYPDIYGRVSDLVQSIHGPDPDDPEVDLDQTSFPIGDGVEVGILGDINS